MGKSWSEKLMKDPEFKKMVDKEYQILLDEEARLREEELKHNKIYSFAKEYSC